MDLLLAEILRERTYHAWFDDGHCGDNLSWAVACVSGAQESLSRLSTIVRGAVEPIRESGIEWKDISGDSTRTNAAVALVTSVISAVTDLKVRIDVLHWSVLDSRHAVSNRDDSENLGMMYYKLILDVARRTTRWVWHIHLDAGSNFSSYRLHKYLSGRDIGSLSSRYPTIFAGGGILSPSLGLTIEKIDENSSGSEALGWVSDIFAGLAHFSRSNPRAVRHVLSEPDGARRKQVCLDGFSLDLTRGEKGKARVLASLRRVSRERSLGVSLGSKRMLWTPNPSQPINFWPYEAQHPDDKAPQRNRAGKEADLEPDWEP